MKKRATMSAWCLFDGLMLFAHPGQSVDHCLYHYLLW